MSTSERKRCSSPTGRLLLAATAVAAWAAACDLATPPALSNETETAPEPAAVPSAADGAGLAVRLPGGAARHPIVYVDGVRVDSPDGVAGLAGLDPRSIERIEVLKSAAAGVFFGEEASGRGVIQVFTKELREPDAADAGEPSRP